MSEPEFSPGPWEAKHNTYALWRVCRGDGVTLWLGGCATPTEADARLTAASPDLLGLVREWLYAFGRPESEATSEGDLDARTRTLLARIKGT